MPATLDPGADTSHICIVERVRLGSGSVGFFLNVFGGNGEGQGTVRKETTLIFHARLSTV